MMSWCAKTQCVISASEVAPDRITKTAWFLWSFYLQENVSGVWPCKNHHNDC